VKALPRLRDHLARSGQRPDLVLCSTARRTLDTLGGIEPAVPEEAQIRIESQIYAASTHTLLALLHRVDDDVGCIMVIGHNPGLQDLALVLTGSGDAALRAQLLAKFPTAAAATLSFEHPWARLGAGDASLDDLFTPRRPPSI
jgi:phosphohistidine phosphatase